MAPKARIAELDTPLDRDDHKKLHRTAAQLERPPFKFAVTMPTNPHWYTVRDRPDHGWTDDEFTEAAHHVQWYGHYQWFRGYRYTQLALNGYSYWTMGNPPEETTIINRKRQTYESPYDEIDHIYDQHVAQRPQGQEQQMREILNVGDGASVADIGCGTGWLLDNYNIEPADYVGIDPSEMMLRRFAAKHPQHIDKVITAKIEHFYPNRRFDVVLALWGTASNIEHTHLDRLDLILNPGGRWIMGCYQAELLTRWKQPAARKWSFTEPLIDNHDCLAEYADEVIDIGRHRVYVGRAA